MEQRIRERFDSLEPLIGHTPLQVFMGALLGVALGWCGAWVATQ